MSKIIPIVAVLACILLPFGQSHAEAPTYIPPIVRPIVTKQVKQVVTTAKKVKPLQPIQLEMIEKIKVAFPDAPVMVKIADAESDFFPTNKNPNSSASGLFQILKGTWEGNKYDPACRHLGDFETNRFDPDKNIACAKILYSQSGTTPWNESKGTWVK